MSNAIEIKISDALAERLRAAAEAEGVDLNNYVVAKLENSLKTDETEDEADDDLIAALRQGIADRDAGRLLTLDQVKANAKAALAARRPRAVAR